MKRLLCTAIALVVLIGSAQAQVLQVPNALRVLQAQFGEMRPVPDRDLRQPVPRAMSVPLPQAMSVPVALSEHAGVMGTGTVFIEAPEMFGSFEHSPQRLEFISSPNRPCDNEHCAVCYPVAECEDITSPLWVSHQASGVSEVQMIRGEPLENRPVPAGEFRRTTDTFHPRGTGNEQQTVFLTPSTVVPPVAPPPMQPIPEVATFPVARGDVPMNFGNVHTNFNDADPSEALELKGLTGHIISASFSPDLERIVTTNHDRADIFIRIWDVYSGEELLKIERHVIGIHSAFFSPDGKTILTAHSDAARIWDATSGEELRRFEGHRGGVQSATFSLCGTKVVTTSNDRTVRIWSVESGEELKKLGPYRYILRAAILSPDGSRIVAINTWERTGGLFWEWKESTTVLDAETGEELHSLPGVNNTPATAFSPDGRRFATIDAVFNVNESRGLFGFSHAASWSKRSDAVRIWCIDSGEELLELAGNWPDTESASFSPDGKNIITVGSSMQSAVILWDADSGDVLERLPAPRFFPPFWEVIAVSPDGKKIATRRDKSVHIWTLE